MNGDLGIIWFTLTIAITLFVAAVYGAKWLQRHIDGSQFESLDTILTNTGTTIEVGGISMRSTVDSYALGVENDNEVRYRRHTCDIAVSIAPEGYRRFRTIVSHGSEEEKRAFNAFARSADVDRTSIRTHLEAIGESLVKSGINIRRSAVPIGGLVALMTGGMDAVHDYLMRVIQDVDAPTAIHAAVFFCQIFGDTPETRDVAVPVAMRGSHRERLLAYRALGPDLMDDMVHDFFSLDLSRKHGRGLVNTDSGVQIDALTVLAEHVDATRVAEVSLGVLNARRHFKSEVLRALMDRAASLAPRTDLLKCLTELLGHDDPSVARQAVEIMSESSEGRARIEDALNTLHASSVWTAAINALTRDGNIDGVREHVSFCAQHTGHPEVQAEAIRWLGTHGDVDSVMLLQRIASGRGPSGERYGVQVRSAASDAVDRIQTRLRTQGGRGALAVAPLQGGEVSVTTNASGLAVSLDPSERA